MAQAIIVTLETGLPDATAIYLKTKSGRGLHRELDRLNLAARTVKVATIESLLSESQASLIEQMKAEGFDPTKMRLPPEQWFTASEGLKVVRSLSAHITENLNNFKQPNPLLKDLKAAEELLIAAEAAGVRFHFTKAVV